MKTVRFSFQRLAVIASNTWTEAARQKVFASLLLIAVGVTASARFFQEFNFGASELKFVMDFGFGAISVFGSVLAIVATAQLFFSEIENRTALTVLAKPVLRSEFIAGKFLGVMLVLLVFTALTTTALMTMLFWRESALRDAYPDAFAAGGIVAYRAIVVFSLLQWLKLGVLAAVTMLIASFSQTNLYTVVMGFLVLVVCHLQYLAVEAWGRANLSWGARVASSVVALVFPNFQLFNLGDDVASGGALTLSIGGSVALYGAAYIVAMLGLSIFSFRRREI